MSTMSPSAQPRDTLRPRLTVPPSAASPKARRGLAGKVTALVATALSLAVVAPPSASADPTDGLSAGVAAYRSGSSCAPLHRDPIIDRVAEVMNKSTSDWLDHSADQSPILDPMPGLRELGYRGSKARMLAGTSRKTEADSIKGVLLEGYEAILDCSFTDVGFSTLRNENTGNVLTVTVLAGP
jgi:hypothetical protein